MTQNNVINVLNEYFWWFFSKVTFPITIPVLLLLFFWRYLKQWRIRNRLSGKVVLITGASSGLGEALAKTFYKAGCKIVLAARREDQLNRVKNDLLSLYDIDPTYIPIIQVLDLTELNDIPEKIDNIIKICGPIDILINNGGIGVRSDIITTTIDIDIKIMLVNYFGSVMVTKTILPSMIERKNGNIIFISSVQGKFAIPQRAAYSASKHAIQAFSDSLRAEVAQFGVKVLCVSPGYIKTSLSKNALTDNGATYGKMDTTTACGYSPEKVANEILKALLNNKKDIIISQKTGIFAYWLRFICPTLYFYIMERRAIKLQDKKDK